VHPSLLVRMTETSSVVVNFMPLQVELWSILISQSGLSVVVFSLQLP
jgi:hypothetical protein